MLCDSASPLRQLKSIVVGLGRTPDDVAALSPAGLRLLQSAIAPLANGVTVTVAASPFRFSS
jgi:hypothetical protein